MKKILMISINDIGSTASLGVTKKILGQYKAFQNLGYDVYNLCLENDSGVLIHGNNKIVLFSKQLKTYLAYIKLFGMASKICEEKHIEFCYIRYPLADWVFMKMIKKLHKVCKLYVEIPTYPYDNETKKNANIIARINFLQDKKNRNKLKEYIDFVVTFSDDKMIWGIPCINIYNGIDVENVKKTSHNENVEGINMIAVAIMAPWHAYDRLIQGMVSYKGKEKISIHLVGDGEEISRYKEIVEQYGLHEKIIFHGFQKGEALQEIYSQCSIAVNSLGLHRIGINKCSTLKSREYAVMGLPIITGCEIDVFPSDECNFVYKAAGDDSPIEIQKVLDWYHSLLAQFQTENSLHDFVSKSAIEKCDLSHTMKPIVDRM